jgi:hypothetical protein
VYDEIHAATLEELGSSLAYVFNVCDPRSDNVDDA